MKNKPESERSKRLAIRNEKIVARYLDLHEVKEHGVRKYTHEYIFKKIADEFYLSPRRIEVIIYNTEKS